MPQDKLTIKQENFCQAYILEKGNASEAYRQAYDAENMKPATINRKAKELMDNGKIAARIGELRAHHMKRHEITVDRVVQELASVGFGNVKDYMTVGPSGTQLKTLDQMSHEEAAAISEVQVIETLDNHGKTATRATKLKLVPKTPALISLGKHLGVFNDSIPVSPGNDGLDLIENTPGDATIEAARRIAYALSVALTPQKEPK